MLRSRTFAVLVGCAVAASCGPAEIRIDGSKGVPVVEGSTEIALSTYTCGSPISAGDETIQTKVVSGGCELSYARDVEVLKSSDYSSIPELKGLSNLVQRVELSISKLAFADGAGKPLDVSTQLVSASLSINDQVVADKSTLTSLPKVVSLSGSALSSLKTAVDARLPASVHVAVVVVVPDNPKPPSTLKVDYAAQPAVILGPGKIL